MPQRRIQPRDIAMLASLEAGRLLQAEALEWLHFPSWRTRYKRQAERREPYEPSSHVYERLAGLRDHGLIASVERSVDLARRVFTRLPAAYVLLQSGAELLCAQHDRAIETLYWERSRKRSLQNLEHSVAIGTCYAALRCALEHHGKRLVGWKGDHLFRDPQTYDRVRVPGQKEPLPVQPDATFLLDGRRYFLELDRNSRPLDTWHEKALAYHAYQANAALRARYGVDDFTLLTVATTSQRAIRIAEQIVKVTRQADQRYLLLELAHIHPRRVRANWMAIKDVRIEMQRVVDRLHAVYHPTLAPVELWSPLPVG